MVSFGIITNERGGSRRGRETMKIDLIAVAGDDGRILHSARRAVVTRRAKTRA